MKLTYSLLGGFVLWCVIASQWYLFGVKGLLTDPAHFKPHETTMAIIEILVMLLVAVLIGFGIAWYLRQSSIDHSQTLISSLQTEKKELMKLKQESDQVVFQLESKLARAQETFRQDFQSLSHEKEKLRVEVEPMIKEAKHWQEELQSLRPKVQLADVEVGRLNFQIKQLENQVTETKRANQQLVVELEEVRNAKPILRKEPVFSDFIEGQRLVYSEALAKDKDNLKLISGIGPVIESKLNSLGIYTFRQISEFTPEAIDHVTSAIKFFPNRIGRDNWIGQAAALARHRK